MMMLSAIFAHSQSGKVKLPERTIVPMILTEEIRENKNKVGTSAKFIVAENVVIDGNILIAQKTPVVSKITISGKRELRVELYEVAAVDGTPVKLNDCWFFTTAAQNLNGKDAMLAKNMRKNCATAVEVTVQPGATKY